MKKTLGIEGMTCGNCVRHVTRALEGLPGASDVSVSLEDKSAQVTVPEDMTDDHRRRGRRRLRGRLDRLTGFQFLSHPRRQLKAERDWDG